MTVPGLMTAPRKCVAVFKFKAGPGRERDAALAWGFELRYYFTRGVSDEPPHVVYKNGTYICAGQMITTHPGDSAITFFDCNDGEGADLDFCLSPKRMTALREIYGRRGIRFDGETS